MINIEELVLSTLSNDAQLYIMTLPENITAEEVGMVRDSIHHVFMHHNISTPVLMLPKSYEFKGVAEFDFSIALKLLKRGKKIKLPDMGSYLYMEYGFIYMRDETSSPDSLWVFTQSELMSAKWMIAECEI
jgi:hypothetical protein